MLLEILSFYIPFQVTRVGDCRICVCVCVQQLLSFIIKQESLDFKRMSDIFLWLFLLPG